MGILNIKTINIEANRNETLVKPNKWEEEENG